MRVSTTFRPFAKCVSGNSRGERVIVLMSSGNLATTQSVVSLLDERVKARSERTPTLLETQSMYQTVMLVGNTVKEVIANSATEGSARSPISTHRSSSGDRFAAASRAYS